VIGGVLLLAGYLWRGTSPADQPLSARFPPPSGWARVPLPPDGFGDWLRGLPLKPGSPPVHLFSGALKANQSVHLAVVDIDTGPTDLQQCADAVIRLRAEYLFAAGRADSLAFHFTSGDLARFADWARGERPVVGPRSVRWVRSAPADSSHASLRRWLDTVFRYAGTRSLARELLPVSVTDVQPGDVFVEGGSPGHAVLVLDVVIGGDGRRLFLLGQSYMPAQEIHVLKNPATGQPWFRAQPGERLATPEWVFPPDALRRFP
jgi:hypothetical protein